MGLRPTKGDETRCEEWYAGQNPGNGRGRNRSGDVETVRECDPERAFGPINVTSPSREEG